tara:strand:+ start:2914 stop:4050 length:1137 start_codon:yes stop_codon:yes gene_type:complete
MKYFSYKKSLKIFTIIIIFLILDFFLTFFFISKYNFYEYFYPKLEHRISNVNYHHSFRENVDTLDHWGSFKYKFTTNSLGFKDKFNRHIINQTIQNRRIIIIGDSFTEGIGYEYKDTFVGLLDKKLQSKNIEILNAGVASQSPIIYYKKIKYFIEIKKIKFDELIVFLDLSDIADEYYYNLNFDINDSKKYKLRDHLQEIFIKNFSTYLFFDIIFKNINLLKENVVDRLKTAKEFDLTFIDVENTDINLYKALNVERGNWTSKNSDWELYGKKGLELSDYYLNLLLELCSENNIDFTLVIYPWPYQIYYKDKSNIHSKYWNKWSKEKNIKLINYFDLFDYKQSEKTIKKLFIEGDIHWNKEGHRYIYEVLYNKHFKSS